MKMLEKQLLLAGMLLCTTALQAETEILHFDMTSQPGDEQVREKTGYFKGVLPKTLQDNYSMWSTARVTSSLQKDAVGPYLHFNVEKPYSQFYFACPNPDTFVPGLQVAAKVEYRSTLDGDCVFELRRSAKPWHTYALWKFPSTNGEWKTVTQTVTIKGTLALPVGFYFKHNGVGEMDIRFITFTALNEEDFK